MRKNKHTVAAPTIAPLPASQDASLSSASFWRSYFLFIISSSSGSWLTSLAWNRVFIEWVWIDVVDDPNQDISNRDVTKRESSSAFEHHLDSIN